MVCHCSNSLTLSKRLLNALGELPIVYRIKRCISEMPKNMIKSHEIEQGLKSPFPIRFSCVKIIDHLKAKNFLFSLRTLSSICDA